MRLAHADDDDPPVEPDAAAGDDGPETVPCPKCGRDIWAYTQRCPHCGVHFNGEAWEFAGSTRRGRRGDPALRRRLFVIVVVLMLIAFALVYILSR